MNFLLNRCFTFSYARDGQFWTQFAGFVGASSPGLTVNYAVSLVALLRFLPDVPYTLQMAALLGIACGLTFNYLGSRFVVFRRKF